MVKRIKLPEPTPDAAGRARLRAAEALGRLRKDAQQLQKKGEPCLMCGVHVKDNVPPNKRKWYGPDKVDEQIHDALWQAHIDSGMVADPDRTAELKYAWTSPFMNTVWLFCLAGALLAWAVSTS